MHLHPVSRPLGKENENQQAPPLHFRSLTPYPKGQVVEQVGIEPTCDYRLTTPSMLFRISLPAFQQEHPTGPDELFLRASF